MISAEHPFASYFLLVSATAFLLVYALPLLFVPLKWARCFLWRIPEETDLTIYLGRCLGGVALAIIVVVLAAASRPEANLRLFDLIALVGAILTAVHAWGAIRKVQPWTEHVEIALYAVLAVVSFAVRAGLTP